ncbi:APG9-domain-containing protein [Daldinia caldariorum]|uniref:APG9-domain-containing protein n=1 Tax=Daldinia caldariorum TaxID=326644 RepID=UPI002008BBB7|nr:APG9-domain-containing protein [Daldinia caldariorum]KAI1462982.1 APG9-domain-containing protein [Daldinia caldariorum]
MPPNLFSRLVPSGDDRPLYDRLRNAQDDDVESRAGLDLDEENLAQHFQEDDLAHAGGAGLDDSRISTPRSPIATASKARRGPARVNPHDARSRWLPPEDEMDNDVPASLLVEGLDATTSKPNKQRTSPRPARNSTRRYSADKRIQAQWETAQARQRLHQDEEYGPSTAEPQRGGTVRSPGFIGSPKDKAMFRWANVSNLDVFIRDVYDYYLGAGMWCILLDRFLHLLKVVFVATLLTLLSQCIDYSKIRDSKNLSQIMIPQCTKHMWGIWNLSLWVCSFYFVWKSIQWILDIPRLMHIRDFFVYLLEIPEEDMQTVSWQDVVAKITALRDENVKTATNITPSQRRFLSKQLGQHIASQSKERLDAHDIANRLMRRENYIIALFNKDILDLTAPIPFLRNRQLFSKSLEWTVQFGVLDLVFNEGGQVHQRVLKSDHRGHLSREMQTRFIFAAVMNLIFAPFAASALLIDFIFTYYNEFKTNTSSLGARQYTPLARWKFREFNELPHLFEERLNMSYPFAKHYIDQFPKKKTESVARTVQFFSGALIAVLAIVGFSDPEMFVDFELFPGMNTFAFVALLTTTWAVARGMISEENDVFDPEFAMRSVIEYTHYQPDQWKGRLHSYEVKAEFSELYKSRIIIFLEEIIGVLITPMVLFFSLPKCSDQIIDFFREFTIHVDGLGYVCSFAVFDFQKDQRTTKQQPGNANDAREDYYATKHGKMQASVHGFLDNYVYHPRTGLPSNHTMGPAGRHQFHPPPAFPGLMSPTLAADMHSSRIVPNERARSRAPVPGRTPRFGPAVAPSPMASMLLDPHHQPSASFIALRTTPQRARQQRGLPSGDTDIIEESTEDGMSRSVIRRHDTAFTDDGDVEESVARLGESTWEGSPRRGISREASNATDGDDGPGVVTLLKQFQQAHLDRRGVM